MSRTTAEILGDAHAHFARLENADRDLDDQLVVDAICMRLSAGIEALARLENADRDRLFGADWTVMWGMRNRIAHGYLLVNAEIVRQTVDEDLPGIVGVIEDELGAGKQ